MSRYMIRRLLRGALTMLVSVTLTFVILRLMPGDPAEVLVDPRMTAEVRAQLLADFGLDKPLWQQYVIYMANLLRGNMGISFKTLLPVTQVISTRIWWTILLMGISFLVTLIVGIPLGVIAAIRRDSAADRVITGISIFGNAVFVPWLAISLLYIFGYLIPVFPIGGAVEIGVTGWERVKSIAFHLVLPVSSLLIINLARYVLFLRTCMVEVMHEDYIRTARAKGVNSRAIIYKHALRNAFLPTLTMMGLQLGYMVGGAVLTETVYAYPGVGRLIYESVKHHDYPVLQGTFIVLALAVIVANILTDLLYSLLDPRVRFD
ncbi:MAG: ABC transporter permease [Bacillota bacterium]